MCCPFKQRQIEQRQLEAEAERVARVKAAEGAARPAASKPVARPTPARSWPSRGLTGMDRVGKVNAEQMAREGALVTKHPLLIQKTLADKLGQDPVIIAPPPTNGDFIGAALLGGNRNAQAGAARLQPWPTTPPPPAVEQ